MKKRWGSAFLLTVLLVNASAATESLDKLASDFWAWRAEYAPFTGDDVNRIERPGGTRDWSRASIDKQQKDLAEFEARWKKLDPTQWAVPQQVDDRLIGSALAGSAGMLIALYYTQIDQVMGYAAGIKAFTAAVLGGIGNVRGAMLGGLTLGITESLSVAFFDPAYKDLVAFVVLIVVLVLRPGGLLGTYLRERV